MMIAGEDDDNGNFCQELLALLSTSFGPCAGKKLCVGHGGSATITSEGLEILDVAFERKRESERKGVVSAKELHLAKVIRDTCTNHVRSVGDGSIYLGILALAGLSELGRLATPETFEQSRRLLQLAQDFGALVSAFESLLDTCLRGCAEEVPLNCREACLGAISNLARTKLACKCSPRSAKLLSALIVGLVDRSTSSSNRCQLEGNAFAKALAQHLSAWTDFSPVLTVPDALLSRSQVLEGIFVNLSPASVIRPERERNAAEATTVRFVAVSCPLDDFSIGAAEAAVGVQSSAEYARASHGFERLAQRRLERLKAALGVSAVISTAKLGDRVKMFAKDLGLDLFFCPCEEEVRRLCSAFGILLCSEASVASLDESGSGHGDNGGGSLVVGVAGELKVLSKGSALILGATHPEPARAASLQTILLCAPTPALCSQYETLIAQAIRVVAASIERGGHGDGDGGGGSMMIVVVPGACLVERRLLWLISDFLAEGACEGNLRDSIALGLSIVKEMAREVLAAAAGNLFGSQQGVAAREGLLLVPLDSDGSAAGGNVGECCEGHRRHDCGNILRTSVLDGEGRRQARGDPREWGIGHPAAYYRQAYGAALQFLHQQLRLM
mmetsp:Transcript_502/g.980  ORF Transcript_502/g.980 Transcript_502/m.980 type:complete len:616 (+) Transcript_502:113-1960(+)